MKLVALEMPKETPESRLCWTCVAVWVGPPLAFVAALAWVLA